MGSFDGELIVAGDTVVVPEDFDRNSWSKVLRTTQYFIKWAWVLALKVLRQ